MREYPEEFWVLIAVVVGALAAAGLCNVAALMLSARL
jgi:hypothetical protein